MVLVSLLDALGTHALLVRAAEQPQRFVVVRAQLRSQRLPGWNQLVDPPPEAVFVDPQVRRAVRLRAHQARFNGFALPPRARAAARLLSPGPLELLHHLPEDVVPTQQRPGGERLAALRAGVRALLLGPVPVVLDAPQAVAVPAGDRHRVPEDLQAHRAPELVLFDRNGRRCHFPHGAEATLDRGQEWAWPTGALMTAFTCR